MAAAAVDEVFDAYCERDEKLTIEECVYQATDDAIYIYMLKVERMKSKVKRSSRPWNLE